MRRWYFMEAALDGGGLDIGARICSPAEEIDRIVLPYVSCIPDENRTSHE
jgi:hypothetical protein